MNRDDILDISIEHYGTKGMRWGQRKKGSHVSTDAKKTGAILVKSKKNATGVKSLTNHELTQLNKRLELEKKFNEHTMKKKQSKIDKGHNHVKKVLAIGATANAAYAFSKTPAGKAVKEQVFGTGKHFAK